MRFVLVAVLLSACGAAPHPPQSTQDVDKDGVADVRDKCAYHPGPDINSGCPMTTIPPPPVTPPSSYEPYQQPPPVATTPPPVVTNQPPVVAQPPATTAPPATAPPATTPPATTPPATAPPTSGQSFPPPPPGGPYRADDPDHDGFPDAHDRCPDDPEDRDGVADDDGCPD